MPSHPKTEQTPRPESGTSPGPRPFTDSSHRYIALRYTLSATYHGSWAEAEDALAEIASPRRAAIVDSRTGKTFATQAAYPDVESAVSGEVLGIMRREGPIGDLTFKRRLRGE